MRLSTIGLVLVVLISAAYPAGENPGAVFLMIWPGSRPTGLSGAFAALADDATATYYNIGGLGFQDYNEVTLQHANWLPGLYPGMYYEFLGATRSLRQKGTIGLNVIYLTTGRTEVINEHGEYLGEYNTFDIATTVGYGFKIMPKLSAGISFKFIYSFLVPDWVFIVMQKELGNITGGVGTTWATDLGLLYKPFNFLSVGAAVQNLGPNIAYTTSGSSDPLPRMLRVGLNYMPIHSKLFRLSLIPEITKVLVGMFYDPLDTLTFSQELGYEYKEAWKSFGIELSYYDLIAARIGYFEDITGARGGVRVKDDQGVEEYLSLPAFLFSKHTGKFDKIGLTFGAGLKFKRFAFDISMDNLLYDFSTDNYKFSLSYQF
jgi:hypothetical protein